MKQTNKITKHERKQTNKNAKDNRKKETNK